MHAAEIFDFLSFERALNFELPTQCSIVHSVEQLFTSYSLSEADEETLIMSVNLRLVSPVQ
jgi:hypothetical protein